jgi:dihydroneopterin aldolase
MDKIFLSQLSIECIVGIWDWERRVKQTVVIDVEMASAIRRFAATCCWDRSGPMRL